MGFQKQNMFVDSQPSIKIPALGKPYVTCPVCKRKINIETTRCTHCGTFLGIKNDRQ